MMSLSSQSISTVPASAKNARSLVSHVSDLMRSEYLEMPCLCLTLRQAMRLWSLERDLCQAGLATLVTEGFLELSPDGRYRVVNHS